MSNKKLIVFYADWCGPCRVYSGIYERFIRNNPDVTLERVNIDNNQQLTEQYGVRSVPTSAFVVNGKTVGQRTGVVQGNQLKEIFK